MPAFPAARQTESAPEEIPSARANRRRVFFIAARSYLLAGFFHFARPPNKKDPPHKNADNPIPSRSLQQKKRPGHSKIFPSPNTSDGKSPPPLPAFPAARQTESAPEEIPSARANRRRVFFIAARSYLLAGFFHFARPPNKKDPPHKNADNPIPSRSLQQKKRPGHSKIFPSPNTSDGTPPAPARTSHVRSTERKTGERTQIKTAKKKARMPTGATPFRRNFQIFCGRRRQSKI